jgi:hypothetical protein
VLDPVLTSIPDDAPAEIPMEPRGGAKVVFVPRDDDLPG